MSEYTNYYTKGFLGNFKLSGLLSSLDKLSKKEMETLNLVFNVDQFQMLLESMNEAQEGQVVSFSDAFDDLN